MWWRVTWSGKSSLRGSSWEGTYRAHSSGTWLWEENIPGSGNTKCKGLVGMSLVSLRNKQKPLSKGEWWGRSVDWGQKFRKEPDQKGPWRSWWSVWILFEVQWRKPSASDRNHWTVSGGRSDCAHQWKARKGYPWPSCSWASLSIMCHPCPWAWTYSLWGWKTQLSAGPQTCDWPPAAGPLPALRTVWLCISLWNVEVCLPLSFTLILPSAVDRSGIWPTSSFTHEES